MATDGDKVRRPRGRPRTRPRGYKLKPEHQKIVEIFLAARYELARVNAAKAIAEYRRTKAPTAQQQADYWRFAKSFIPWLQSTVAWPVAHEELV